MIRYRCGKCGNEMESPESMIGHTEKCPGCGAHVKIPPPKSVKAKPLGLMHRVKYLPIWVKVSACAAGVLVYSAALFFVIDYFKSTEGLLSKEAVDGKCANIDDPNFEGDYFDDKIDLQRCWSVKDRRKFKAWKKAAMESWLKEWPGDKSNRAEILSRLLKNEFEGDGHLSIAPSEEGDVLIYSTLVKSKKNVSSFNMKWIRYRGSMVWVPKNDHALVFDSFGHKLN